MFELDKRLFNFYKKPVACNMDIRHLFSPFRLHSSPTSTILSSLSVLYFLCWIVAELRMSILNKCKFNTILYFFEIFIFRIQTLLVKVQSAIVAINCHPLIWHNSLSPILKIWLIENQCLDQCLKTNDFFVGLVWFWSGVTTGKPGQDFSIVLCYVSIPNPAQTWQASEAGAMLTAVMPLV